MQQKVKINFQQERDFGALFSDTLLFVKQNFLSFFGSIILIAGPLILVMGLAYAYVQTSIMSIATRQQDPSNPLGIFNGDYFFGMGLIFLSATLAFLLVASVTFHFMCLYNEKPIEEKITISEVSKRVFSNIGNLIASAVTLIVLMCLVLLVVVLIGIGLGSGLGVAGGILIGLTLFFGLIILMPVMHYFMTAIFYVIIRDNIFLFPAMGKVKKYLSGNFWWTWLIMVVLLIALSVAQGLFNLPATIITMGKMFSRIASAGNTEEDSSVLLMIFYTLGMFLSYCSYSVSHIASAFNYLSQEEKHEGKGMMAQIESI